MSAKMCSKIYSIEVIEHCMITMSKKNIMEGVGGGGGGRGCLTVETGSTHTYNLLISHILYNIHEEILEID